MMSLENFIKKRYEGYAEKFIPLAVSHITQLWENYKELADRHFLEEFTSVQPGKFQQRYWEMLLAQHFRSLGYIPTSADEGPDLKMEMDGVPVWIEAVAPLPCETIKQYHKEMECDGAAFSPSNAYSLRYTQAFKDKLDKINKYIERGIINLNTDAVIIAINSGNLGLYCGNGFDGKTRYPFIVDITYGVGSYYGVIDNVTGALVREGVETELHLKKTADVSVPKAYFRDGSANIISAVIGSDAAPETAVSRPYAFHAVHNMSANIKLPLGKLGCTQEHFVDSHKKVSTIDYSVRAA
jgi:hypothetical protein